MKETLFKDCECWEYTVSLDLIDRRVPKDAIQHIYCPRCSPGIRQNKTRMVGTKGWLIEYNPNLLSPVSSTIRLIQNHDSMGSFRVYSGKNNLLENDI